MQVAITVYCTKQRARLRPWTYNRVDAAAVVSTAGRYSCIGFATSAAMRANRGSPRNKSQAGSN